MHCPPASTNGDRASGRKAGGAVSSCRKSPIKGSVFLSVPVVFCVAAKLRSAAGDTMMPLRELSEAEAAYAAGIVDGEGTITLTRMHRSEGRRPVVSISSTELPLLQYIRSIIGAGRITGKVTARDHHSPSFAYVISGRQALTLLARISPYLRTYKLQRCRLLLDEYLAVTPRNGRYTCAQRAAKELFEARFFALSVRAGTNRGGRSLNGDDDDRGIRAACEARAGRP